MTIIKSKGYVTHYPLQAIDEELAYKLLMSPTTLDRHNSNALQLFDCHCHCLGEYLSLTNLDGEKLTWLVESFLGSLHVGDIAVLEEYIVRQRSIAVTEMISGLVDLVPGLQPVIWSRARLPHFEQTWQESKHKLDPEIVSFWSGWKVKAKKGKSVYLKLVAMYHSHGPEFTKAFHEAIRRDSLKRAKVASGMINKLAKYISEQSFRFPPAAFQSPEMMEDFFEHYFWHYQNIEYERNEDPELNARTFRTMRNLIIRCFLKTDVWSADEDAIVLPAGKSKAGSELNIKKNKHGIEIKDKLLTEVPVHVTDIQAIDLLYGEITSDLSCIEKWGLSEALAIRKAQRIRVREAGDGMLLERVVRNPQNRLNFEKLGFANICRTFEDEGMCTTNDARRRYGIRLPALALKLGLPTTYSLLPFQCLLTLYHPEITTTFMDDLVIWDGPKRVSFLKTDKGYELIGFKDRRGSKNSEQKILLHPKAAALVRMVEEITEPLRQYLKKQGDPTWQKLFLTCGRSFNYPKTADSNILNRTAVDKNAFRREVFIARLSPHTVKRGDDLVDFIKKLSITRVRAQSAVADYIQNHSLPRLARKLGHAHMNRDLLDSYLPTAIYDFFATRYVRIFQKGIICEAMKDSKYLLRASKFDDFDQMHEFLSRYTLKEVPENLKTREENRLANGEIVEVGVSVSAESMTALMSIRKAINLSKTPHAVRGLAKYWAAVCDMVEKYILKSRDKLLHAHLEIASKNCNPSAYESMIHAVS
ncbi:hypothetical protein [Pseudomonas sp.]|uniref:hypothetical protein n=1 Tax=Pseudomonas sp. TaxID=306 RepID=UPI000E91186C|nr:hypothetical protein [Pseudomonas sp.]HBP47395.1 hypothetical protein [Pseudomonas sp.]